MCILKLIPNNATKISFDIITRVNPLQKNNLHVFPMLIVTIRQVYHKPPINKIRGVIIYFNKNTSKTTPLTW